MQEVVSPSPPSHWTNQYLFRVVCRPKASPAVGGTGKIYCGSSIGFGGSLRFPATLCGFKVSGSKEAISRQFFPSSGEMGWRQGHHEGHLVLRENVHGRDKSAIRNGRKILQGRI